MTDQTPAVVPETAFEWRLYANATFAGLSPLIPLVPLDLLTEYYFQRRMLRAIATLRGIPLAAEIEQEINRRDRSCWSCLSWPLLLAFTILKKLSRKILYFLTIKEASDLMSYYWHRAFLYDYMLKAGQLETLESARVARMALEQVLVTTTTSPLYRIAGQVVANARHVARTLRTIRRRGEEDEVVSESRAVMGAHWQEAETHLEKVAQQYEALYQQLYTQEQIRLVADAHEQDLHAQQETDQTP